MTKKDFLDETSGLHDCADVNGEHWLLTDIHLDGSFYEAPYLTAIAYSINRTNQHPNPYWGESADDLEPWVFVWKVLDEYVVKKENGRYELTEDWEPIADIVVDWDSPDEIDPL